MEIPYTVVAPRFAHTAAGAIVQITAGAYPLSILEWKVNQTDQVVSQLHEITVCRMASPAAGGNASTPAPLGAGAGAAGFTARTASFSDQGTVGDVLEIHAWNVVNSSLPWNPVPTARIEVPPGGTVALRLTSPAIPTTLNLFGYVKVLERR